MLLRPSLRKYGSQQEISVLFPRHVLRTHDQYHFFNCPFQANAKNFASVTNELDVNVTLHWFDLEQEEGLRDHSPYKQVSFLEPGASTSLGTFVGHVFAVGDEEGRFLGQVTVRGIGDAAVINEALIAEAETCQEGSIPHDPHAAQGPGVFLFLKSLKRVCTFCGTYSSFNNRCGYTVFS